MKSNPTNITDFTPKGYLIRYPLLVDSCVLRLVDDFQSDFKRRKDGSYVLAKKFSYKDMKTLLERYLYEERDRLLSKAFQGLSPSKSDWIIVADSGSDRRASYKMIESDIDIGLKRIETIFNSIFNNFMRQKRCTDQTIYCKHRLLLSSDWELICKKKLFGARLLTVLTPRKSKVIEESTTDEKTRSLSKSEQGLVVKEAVGWVKDFLKRI